MLIVIILIKEAWSTYQIGQVAKRIELFTTIEMPRILVLVICPPQLNHPRWKMEYSRWQTMMLSKPDNIDCFFISCGQEAVPQFKKNHRLFLPCQESVVPGIYRKTLLALQHFSGQYDYYIRTNLSTIVVWNQLNQRLQEVSLHHNSLSPIYLGDPSFSPGAPVEVMGPSKQVIHWPNSWVSGTNIIINEASNKKLLARGFESLYWDSNTPDDVLIGEVLYQSGIQPDYSRSQNLMLFDPENEKDVVECIRSRNICFIRTRFSSEKKSMLEKIHSFVSG